MFGVLGSMVPLLVVLLLVLYFVLRARNRLAKMPPELRLSGVSGWLAFYVYTTSVVAPLVMMSRLMTALTDAESKNTGLTNVPSWSTYKSVEWSSLVLYVAWLWWVNYGLTSRFVPSSVRRVKFFIVTGQIALVAVDWTAGMALFGVDTIGEQLKGLAPGIASTIIWFWYFSISKRVRATYYGAAAEPKQLATPAPSFEAPLAPVDVAPAATVGDAVREAQATTDSTAIGSLEHKLGELARLLERGLVSQVEYDTKKAELIARL